MTALRTTVISVGLCVLTGVSVGLAQTTREFDASRVYISRQELVEMLERLETVASSDAYSVYVREQSRQEADLVRERLEQGDFRVGDRIWMVVEAESSLTDTFTVRQGPLVRLPQVGDVGLEGVLRFELEGHITNHLQRFIRNPVVRVQPLIPVTVVGGVAAPGFYTIPTDAILTDALMVAGGPTSLAKINEITIERDQKVLWDKDYVARAIVEGRTVDEMSLRAGDQIVVPARDPPAGGRWLRILLFVVSIPVAVYGLTRIF